MQAIARYSSCDDLTITIGMKDGRFLFSIVDGSGRVIAERWNYDHPSDARHAARRITFEIWADRIVQYRID